LKEVNEDTLRQFAQEIIAYTNNHEMRMGDVEKMMQFSVRNVLLKSIEDYTVRPRNDWILNHAGMCVLNGS
jgi:hypothetical protein